MSDAPRFGDLTPNAANYVPLTPVSFLVRSAAVFPDRIAVIDGDRRFTYAEFHRRCRQLASALHRHGVRAGETVSILSPNVTAMLEAHFGVPMIGAVLNPLNTRLNAAGIAFCLRHSEGRLVLAHEEHAETVRALARDEGLDIDIIAIGSGESAPAAGLMDYEAFLRTGDTKFQPPGIDDEWMPISLGYTSGTTGDPKGVVSSHRGAYLNVVGNMMASGFDEHAVYLWTLPMFHCNGWSHTWAVTAAGGTHVCTGKFAAPAALDLIGMHGVTHFSAAPVALALIAEAASRTGFVCERKVRVLTGGFAPTTSNVTEMERLGFEIVQLYGLGESTGPNLFNSWQQEWDALPESARLNLKTRQGIPVLTVEDVNVGDLQTGGPVPADGRTLGEILIRSNTVTMGYFKNPEANAKAFEGGWFHTGDMAVRDPDGHIQIKDRLKDVVISGGEGISSIEIEEVLSRHPGVFEAAVVARPDAKWGEHPCAFIAPKEDVAVPSASELAQYCRQNMARFKVPKTFVFGPLPKTATGKVQKYILRERARALRPAASEQE